MPKNIEDYYQQIGRAGRDGLKTETMMFYSLQDVFIYRRFIDQAPNNKEIELSKLKRIQEFAEAQTCRRKILLSYFGEHLEKDCGNCDVCNNPPKQFDGTIIAQKALSALFRLEQNVGMTMLINVLRGAGIKELYDKSYQNIKTFGVGKDISFFDWQQYILQLLNQGFIEIAYDENNNIKITEVGEKVLFNNKKVNLVHISELNKKNEEKNKKIKPINKTQQIKIELFEKLKELRSVIAESESVPPHVIFSDLSLQAMADLKPTDATNFSNIQGVGEYKNQKYGKSFINEIIKFIIEKTKEGASIKGSTYIVTFSLLNQGFSINEIAKSRKLNDATIYSHIGKLYADGKNIDIFKYISTDELKEIKKAIDEKGVEKGAKPIFYHLEEKISYGKINLGMIYWQKNNSLI